MLNKDFCPDANKHGAADYLRTLAEPVAEFFAAESPEQRQKESHAADKADCKQQFAR